MSEFIEWLADLDPVFLFLLLLPFAIGTLAVLADRLESSDRGSAENPVRRKPRDAERHAGRLTVRHP